MEESEHEIMNLHYRFLCALDLIAPLADSNEDARKVVLALGDALEKSFATLKRLDETHNAFKTADQTSALPC